MWTDCELEIYQNATRVFVRSQNIVNSLLEDYGIGLEKIECVYAGSNVDVDSRPALPISVKKEPNVLFIGFEWERKGGPDLVKAMAQVQQTIPEASLTVIGCHPEIGLPNSVTTGPLPPDELEPYFEAARLFCMPSRVEPFGIVYVEAMARGLPVVATRIGAITDMVQSGVNGLLVEPGDVDGLARALLQLLTDSNKAAVFGEAGLNLASTRYNWDNVVARMAAAIEKSIRVEQ